MKDIVKLLRRYPLAVIGTAAIVGLALGGGVIPLPGIGLGRPAPAAAPATPAPPPDPIDAY
jgi:hypothetical protein